MNDVLLPAVALLCMASLSVVTVDAAPVPVRRSPMVMTTFRLHVAGRPGAQTTFWVAYGPLAGRWGLVRLHAGDRGLYAATRSLPRTGCTMFAYLVGSGARVTRAGRVPGNPTVTIRLIGPTSVSIPGRITVQWHTPIG